MLEDERLKITFRNFLSQHKNVKTDSCSYIYFCTPFAYLILFCTIHKIGMFICSHMIKEEIKKFLHAICFGLNHAPHGLKVR